MKKEQDESPSSIRVLLRANSWAVFFSIRNAGAAPKGRTGTLGGQLVNPVLIFVRLVRTGFANLFLYLPNRLLGFALDLLAGVSLDRADNVIGFAFDLLNLASSHIFVSHDDLLSG